MKLSAGKHLLTIIAEDNCGKEDTTTCKIEVKDCKKPTPYCYNGIATVIMPSTGSIIVWAKDLDAGSYDNCTKKADLKFSFDADGKMLSDTFTCKDIPNGIAAINEVDIYVTDATGNVDFCHTILNIQDGSGNICGGASDLLADVSGKILTETSEPVEQVTLDTRGGQTVPSFKTSSSGTYAFDNLPMYGAYSIIPVRTDHPTNGVSTIDLILIQKHIIGEQVITSPYHLIAADADKSGDISAIDLIELRKLILTVYDKLPNTDSWRFVPKDYIFTNPANPWNFPEKIDLSTLSKDEVNRDFIGIKVGDLNSSVVPHSLLGAESRGAADVLRFKIIDQSLKAGEETVVEFTAENFRQIEGYQFTLAMKGLELKSIEPGKLKISNNNFGLTKLGQGYITTSWNDNTGIYASFTDVLFSIKVKATRDITLSESMFINSKYTHAEAYKSTAVTGSSLGVALEVGSRSTLGYALHQNTPNPFTSSTMIAYELAKADKVTLKITDITGRVVRVYHQDGVKGFNQLKVSKIDLTGSGVMYYTLETKDFSAAKKMILID
ncbi:MAG: T9SS type A sorting domain-containing protein [Saprospiraceae bacterium]|nr:T9SS type A sorting domain-containing protein [Saprospiraceae bacterium]